MAIDHGGFHIGVAKQFLNRWNILPDFNVRRWLPPMMKGDIPANPRNKRLFRAI